MKVGLLTFHWATNYGAVLQTFALQEYLISLGLEVEVIDYKPKKYDLGIRDFLRAIRHPKTIPVLVHKIKRENALRLFRSKRLNMTKQRFFNERELTTLFDKYDAIISGSDQVLNPAFVLDGEGKPTSAYFLQFASPKTRKIGYAISFGTSFYPEEASTFANRWINSFTALSVRERSGLAVANSLGYSRDCSIVPDPTLLFGTNMFKSLGIRISMHHSPFLFCFMLHGVSADLSNNTALTLFDTSDYSMESWIMMISSSSGVITNSYHAMLVSILFHRQFVVVLEGDRMEGMNDRFYTVLERLNLLTQVVHNTGDEISTSLKTIIDWDDVDSSIEDYRRVGSVFLMDSLYESSLVQ